MAQVRVEQADFQIKDLRQFQRYKQFIEGRKGFSENEELLHDHHILPRSLGGTDHAENIISLTLREHYIAHWALWKSLADGNMAFAFHMMSSKKENSSGTRISAREYEQLEKETVEFLKEVYRHSNSKKITCEVCGKTLFKWHFVQHNHGVNCSRKTIECEICGKKLDPINFKKYKHGADCTQPTIQKILEAYVEGMTVTELGNIFDCKTYRQAYLLWQRAGLNYTKARPYNGRDRKRK